MAEPRTDTGQERDRLLQRFDQAWQSGTPPRINEFLAFAAAASLRGPALRAFLEELVQVDIEYRWRGSNQTAGTRPPQLEEYAVRHPELGPPGQVSLDLIAWEYRMRHRWGDQPSHAEYLARFAGRSDAVRHALAQTDAELATLPALGHSPRCLQALRNQPL